MQRFLRGLAACGVAVAVVAGAAGISQGFDRPPPELIERVGAFGCTPGFWKNHPHAWAVTGMSADASFNDVFGVDYPGGDVTLLAALQRGGGDYDALGRHAVAGLLNALHPNVDYRFLSGDVLGMVQHAVATNDPLTPHLALAAANEAGCPINGK